MSSTPQSGGLGEFLKSRRNAVTPGVAGISNWGKRRRVPGLRREEVAQLAGVSVAYYVRLEQGQAHNASDEVLLPIVRALCLPLPRLLFLDPQVRDVHPDWEAEARTYVAYLRLISDKYPNDSRLAELIGELCMKNADFAALWASGHVAECTGGTKHFQHPLVGALTVNFQVWLQADTPDHRLEVYTPADGPSADALAVLTTLTHEKRESFAERSGRS